jgi:hypothetical protein
MSIFVCCEREDETKYFHTCDCPILTPVNRTRNRTATMCGQLDPDADDGVYYKQIDTVYAGAYIGSGESSVTYSRDEDGVCSSESTPRGDYCDNLFLDGGTYYTTRTTTVTLSGGASGVSGDCSLGSVSTSSISGSYSASSTTTTTRSAGNDGCETNTTSTYTGSSSYNASDTCCPCCSGCPTFDISCTSSRNEDGTWSGSITEVFFDGEETTTTTTPISDLCPYDYMDPSESSTTYSGPVPVTEQEGSVTYSSADTDSDAADAAEWSEWSGVAVGRAISYDQDRNETGSFVQQEAEYAFIAKSLVIGKSYSASVVTEDCDYIKGEPENCVEGTPISVSFTATDVFEIIGGTLNSNVSRDDFVENEYSISPETYGLPEGEEVIESLTAFSVSSGEKRQMVESPILGMD